MTREVRVIRRALTYSWAVGVIALGVTACVPFPHRHYSAPTMTGVVVNAGVPVANAEVRLSAGFTDVKTATAITDTHGRFTVGPLRNFACFAPLIGDPYYAFSLKIVTGGRGYPGFLLGRVGFAPKRIQVECDLAKPEMTDLMRSHCVVNAIKK